MGPEQAAAMISLETDVCMALARTWDGPTSFRCRGGEITMTRGDRSVLLRLEYSDEGHAWLVGPGALRRDTLSEAVKLAREMT